jgi:hypothetical protein
MLRARLTMTVLLPPAFFVIFIALVLAVRNDQAPHRPLQLADWQMGSRY